MNITVELNDEQLSALITEGIQNLDAETKQELVISAIKKYLSEPGVMNKLIFSQTGYSYNAPSQFFRELVAKNVENSKIKELQDQMIDYAAKNKSDILCRVLADTIARSVMTEGFKDMLATRLGRIENALFPNN
uniref:Uncharacterized protein n=1 Tax=Myoviridae sp. ctwwN25 TaxID=2825209 RepID=A0A8S5PNK4_9CAUD|nr:MAG TPA: hypothetical protein [Myoviridae sp. ctwwN25]